MEVMSADDRDYQAEGTAARIFFGVSALFLVITLATYMWLTRQTSYRSLISTVKQRSGIEDTDELTRLYADDRRRIPPKESSSVYGVLIRNWIFMFSIAHVFTVTLVSPCFVVIFL